MNSIETNKAAGQQSFSTEASFRYLFTHDFKKAEKLAFDLIGNLPFPHLDKVNEDKASILASWEFALALDALPSNAAKVKAVRKLLNRLGYEFIEETRWNGSGRYDGEVLNSVAIGMARAYHSLPLENQGQVWGFSPWEAQDHFAILTRTIGYNAHTKDSLTRQGRLGLQSLLLGLVEQHPTLLNNDFDNPIPSIPILGIGVREAQLINPSVTVLELVEWEYEHHNSSKAKQLLRSTTVSGIPLSLGETEDRLSSLAHAANQKAYERGLEGVLESH